jgi:hypothetical protein
MALLVKRMSSYDKENVSVELSFKINSNFCNSQSYGAIKLLFKKPMTTATISGFKVLPMIRSNLMLCTGVARRPSDEASCCSFGLVKSRSLIGSFRFNALLLLQPASPVWSQIVNIVLFGCIQDSVELLQQ